MLLVGELISEFGVFSSILCKPNTLQGLVLAHGDIQMRYKTIFVAATQVLEPMEFFEGNLTSLQSGLPSKVTPNVCTKCVPENYPFILRNCSVSLWKTYKAGELKVTFSRSDSIFDSITEYFEETNGTIRYNGFGDVIVNDGFYSSFLFSVTSESDLNTSHFLEYNNQEHVKALLLKARNQSPDVTDAEDTQTAVPVYNISCQESHLSAYNLAYVARTFRMVQLENHIQPPTFNASSQRFSKSFTSDSLYRAAWAAKIFDVEQNNGTVYLYTSCGMYDWRFLLPLCGAVLFFTSVFIYSSTVCRRNAKYEKYPLQHGIWNLIAIVLQKREKVAENVLSLVTKYHKLFDYVFVEEEETESECNLVLKTY